MYDKTLILSRALNSMKHSHSCKILIMNLLCDLMFQDLQNALEGSGSPLTLTAASGLIIEREEPLSFDILDLTMTVRGVEYIIVAFYDVDSRELDNVKVTK